MINSSSWLKLVSMVPEILSPLSETRCCHGLSQGTWLWWGGLKLRSYCRLLDLAQVWAGPQWTKTGGPQSPERGAGETNSLVPLPAASSSKVGITIPNDGHPKVRQFSCAGHQINILILNPLIINGAYLTGLVRCLTFRQLKIKDMTLFSIFTSQSWICLGHIPQRTNSHQYSWASSLSWVLREWKRRGGYPDQMESNRINGRLNLDC